MTAALLALGAVAAVADVTTPSWDYVPSNIKNVCVDATSTTPSGQQNARTYRLRWSPVHVIACRTRAERALTPRGCGGALCVRPPGQSSEPCSGWMQCVGAACVAVPRTHRAIAGSPRVTASHMHTHTCGAGGCRLGDRGHSRRHGPVRRVASLCLVHHRHLPGPWD